MLLPVFLFVLFLFRFLCSRLGSFFAVDQFLQSQGLVDIALDLELAQRHREDRIRLPVGDLKQRLGACR